MLNRQQHQIQRYTVLNIVSGPQTITNALHSNCGTMEHASVAFCHHLSPGRLGIPLSCMLQQTASSPTCQVILFSKAPSLTHGYDRMM